MDRRRDAIPHLSEVDRCKSSKNQIYRLKLEVAGYIVPNNTEERSWLFHQDNCERATNTEILTRAIVNDADEESLPRVKFLKLLKQIEEKPGFVIRNLVDPAIVKSKAKSSASQTIKSESSKSRVKWITDDLGQKIAFGGNIDDSELRIDMGLLRKGMQRGSENIQNYGRMFARHWKSLAKPSKYRKQQSSRWESVTQANNNRKAVRMTVDAAAESTRDNLASLICMGRDYGGKQPRKTADVNTRLSAERIPIADAVIKVQKGHQPATWDFTEICDQDPTQIYEDYVSEVVFGRFVESSSFRLAVMVAILANTIITGLQTIPQVENTFGIYIEVADKFFLGIFTLEILTKWCVAFWDFWLGGWNCLDFFLVFISMVGEKLSFLRTGRLLRIFRVIRAVRSLRSLEFFTGMSVVVTTIASAIPDMMNIIALCLIVMFIFAIIGVDLFGASSHLESLPAAFYSLFVVMTQDGWKDIYVEMKSQGFHTELYFIVWIFFGAFLFSNLIIGVIVTNLERVTETERIRKKFSHRDITKSVKGSKRHIFQQKKKISGILSINNKNLRKLWMKPRPPQVIPKFTNMNLERFENILLIVVALERALAERKNLRISGSSFWQGLMLMEVLDEIDVLNFEKMFEEEEDSDEGSNSSGGELMGDVLTRLIEQTGGWKLKRKTIDRLEKINSERLKQWDEEFAINKDYTLLKAFEKKFCR